MGVCDWKQHDWEWEVAAAGIAANAKTDRLDARRHPRFLWDADVKIVVPEKGMLPARCLDISESGMSAILAAEIPVGITVVLNFKLPSGPVNVRAVTRQRTAFRYGFQFSLPNPALEVIRASLRLLPACVAS